jgi:hypothetical protein
LVTAHLPKPGQAARVLRRRPRANIPTRRRPHLRRLRLRWRVPRSHRCLAGWAVLLEVRSRETVTAFSKALAAAPRLARARGREARCPVRRAVRRGSHQIARQRVGQATAGAAPVMAAVVRRTAVAVVLATTQMLPGPASEAVLAAVEHRERRALLAAQVMARAPQEMLAAAVAPVGLARRRGRHPRLPGTRQRHLRETALRGLRGP